MNKKKALFVLHETTKTGGIFFIQEIIDSFSSEYEIDIFTNQGGDHFDALLKKVSNITILEDYFPRDPKTTLFKKVMAKIHSFQLSMFLKRTRYDFIYFNCYPSLLYYKKIRKLINNSKQFLHLHELGFIIDSTGIKLDETLYENFQSVITVSEKNKDCYVNKLNIDRDKISVISPKLNTKRNQAETTIKVHKGKIKVIGVGSIYWLKGVDLFIDVAEHLENADVELYWFGEVADKDYMQKLEWEIKRRKITNFSLMGFKDNSAEIYSNQDILLITSREDSFPLTFHEAASWGVVPIAFEGNTGLDSELKKIEKNLLFKYPDTIAVAQYIEKISRDNFLLKELKDRTLHASNEEINTPSNLINQLVKSHLK